MYLTRLELDIKKRSTMKALVSPNIFHSAVESAFPGERERNLWRIDRLNNRYYLLILSDKIPQLDYASERFGYGNKIAPYETKDYSLLLNRVKNHTRWRFRLTANPTKSLKSENEARGKVHAHITPLYQQRWLIEHSHKNGFSVDESSLTITDNIWYKFRKNNDKKHSVTFLAVSYEGILTITDAEKFHKVLINGIGREKAYGMGMMTVIKAGD